MLIFKFKPEYKTKTQNFIQKNYRNKNKIRKSEKLARKHEMWLKNKKFNSFTS